VGVVMMVCPGLATPLARTARRDGSTGETRPGPIALALRTLCLGGEAPQGDNPNPDGRTATVEPSTPEDGPPDNS
jgi:hypothetical protein